MQDRQNNKMSCESDATLFASDASKTDVITLTDAITREGISNEEVIKIYETWASTYDQHVETAHNQSYNNAIGEIRKLGLKKDVRIMDIACGTGRLGEELAKIGFTNLDGLDGSQEMLEKAKERNIYNRLMTVLFGAEPVRGIEDDTYGVCIAIGCFTVGHLESDCMQEIIRMTQPGGHVVMQISDHGLAGVAGFQETVDAHIAAKKWKLVSSTRITLYDNMEGTIFTFQVL
ncbi:methyltransferase-like protein 27 [Lineus longissimus]|uniref:methyltransferase-like protein 27 n=1 Tax=Lineus longissimus TaxID=88925 RepID=UPI00315CBA9B